MKPPSRNWKPSEAKEEQKIYTFEKPKLVYSQPSKEEKAKKQINSEDAIIQILEEIGEGAYKRWDIDQFMEKYKTIEKFLLAQLKNKDG